MTLYRIDIMRRFPHTRPEDCTWCDIIRRSPHTQKGLVYFDFIGKMYCFQSWPLLKIFSSLRYDYNYLWKLVHITTNVSGDFGKRRLNWTRVVSIYYAQSLRHLTIADPLHRPEKVEYEDVYKEYPRHREYIFLLTHICIIYPWHVNYEMLMSMIHDITRLKHLRHLEINELSP